ncbi:AAC(3) family N-acetyltransferase [Xanthomarina sp. GH4-25]|uniref:AAC(3) family N-acetyltransferase n=1 Tax=Xanthomarina sp. GH4-25 TaxID=3349335 RepID=UPI003877EB6C
MKDRLTVFFINLFSSDLKNKIKHKIINFKNKYPKVIVFFNGSFTTNDLTLEIERKLGKDPFDFLMIHSSINNLMPMYKGNIKELLDALIKYSELKGITLVMPVFTLGKKNSGIEKYYSKKNIFNVDKTPTTVGLLNELFRRKRGVLRSIHPTHSIAAYGTKAEELTANHHKSDTPFGRNTPFGIMDSYNTKILGLGVYYYRNLTHVHVAEDLLKENFPFPIERKYNIIPVTLISKDESTLYNLKCYTDSLSNSRDLTILKKYMNESNLSQWNYKGVPMFLANASAVTNTLIEIAKEGKSIYKK